MQVQGGLAAWQQGDQIGRMFYIRDIINFGHLHTYFKITKLGKTFHGNSFGQTVCWATFCAIF
jgi:hypothetical protein